MIPTPRPLAWSFSAFHWAKNQHCTASWKAMSSASSARQGSSAAGSWSRRALSGQSYQAVSPKWVFRARYRAYASSQGLAAAKSRTAWASVPDSREKARRSRGSRHAYRAA